MKTLLTIVGLLLLSYSTHAQEIKLNQVCQNMIQTSLAAQIKAQKSYLSGIINLEDYKMQMDDEQIVIRIQARSCALYYDTDERENVIHKFLDVFGLNNSNDQNQDEKIYLSQIKNNAKLVDILTEVGLQKTITKANAEFAIFQLNLNRAERVAELNQQLKYSKDQLQKPNLPMEERQIHEPMLKIIPQLIQDENQRTDKIVEEIHNVANE